MVNDIERKMAGELSAAARGALYKAYELAYQLTEPVAAAMATQKLSKAALARKMGVSRSYLAPVLDASPRLDIRRLAEVYTALGLDLWSHLAYVGQRGPQAAPGWSQADFEAWKIGITPGIMTDEQWDKWMAELSTRGHGVDWNASGERTKRESYE